jgi:hypothetical protein
MGYRWKKAVANAVAIFLGVVIAKIGVGDVPWTWFFWKHVLANAGSVTFFAELRYIYKALADFANGGT